LRWRLGKRVFVERDIRQNRCGAELHCDSDAPAAVRVESCDIESSDIQSSDIDSCDDDKFQSVKTTILDR